MLGADAHSNIQLAYMGKSFQMCVGTLGSFSLNKIYTSAGFLTENTYSYRFTLYGGIGYFILPRLHVFGGAQFSGNSGSLDDVIYAYVSLNYFLIKIISIMTPVLFDGRELDYGFLLSESD